MGMNIPPEAYNQYEQSAVMPDNGNYPTWNGPGNGPGSPSDVNPWYGQSNMQPPMNDLMYRYPQGQTPDFGAMFRYFEQQRQQPNTVSGILQQGGQQPQQMPATGIVAPREQIVPNGQMSPAELQARQNGTFKGYNY
jgi:hypothetical protein